MEDEKKEKAVLYQIIQFKPKYRDGVIEVIGKNLVDLGVVSESSLPIDDEDLFKIPEVYSGKGRFWVAVENDKVIGTVAIRDVGKDTAKLNRMFVLKEHHGKGVGQKLLDQAISFAKEHGFKEVILNTHLNMNRAHHFYEKNGFKKVGQTEDKYNYKLEL